MTWANVIASIAEGVIWGVVIIIATSFYNMIAGSPRRANETRTMNQARTMQKETGSGSVVQNLKKSSRNKEVECVLPSV